MLLRFTKMHGLGNDFMVLDLVSQHAHILPKHAKQWGDRHTGIGFDQLLIVEAPSNPEVDFRYRIFNSDGSEVEQWQRRALLRALCAGQAPDRQTADPRRDQERRDRAGYPQRRPDQRQHGRATPGAGGHSVRGHRAGCQLCAGRRRQDRRHRRRVHGQSPRCAACQRHQQRARA